MYNLDLGLKGNGKEIPGIILITETDHHLSLGDPTANPDIKLIEIYGKQVLRTDGDHVLGQGSWFAFNHIGIYYIVELYNFSDTEALKVIESMIKRLE